MSIIRETNWRTFQFFPCTDKGKSKKIANMCRLDLGLMVRYLTGHAHLRRHNKIANTMLGWNCQKCSLQDPDELVETDDREIRCRLCKLKGREETPAHTISPGNVLWHGGPDGNIWAATVLKGMNHYHGTPSHY